MSNENSNNNTSDIPAQMGGVNIDWDDANLESVYANIGTATANREEFFLLFGMHQNWRGAPATTEERQIDVALSHRVVMSPFAAKRLAIVLQQSLGVYEKQFGEIKL